MTVTELKQKRKELVAKMAAISELESPKAEDVTAFDGFKKDCDALDAQIARHEYVASQRAKLDQVDPVPARPAAGPAPARRPGTIENPGFESIGELIYCARFRPEDRRISALMEQGVGTGGGIGVPTVFEDRMQMIAAQAGIVRALATVVPAGDAPDAEFELPALNQGSGKGMFGGAAVGWTSEGGSIGETKGDLRSVKWNPKEVTAKTTVTNKLLENWRAAGAFIEQILASAIVAAEDVAFLNGNGGNQPRGIITAPASKTRARDTAAHIKYADLVAMESKLHEDMPAVWIASPTAIAELRVIVDGASRYIWTEGSAEGNQAINARPATLLGRPVIKSFRSPAMGTKGDLILADPSKYIIKDGRGLQIDASKHVYFETNKTVIKAVKSVDGAPWLDAPFAQEDSATYSPFVVLANNGVAEI